MQNATAHGGALEHVGPYMFARVQESKGASGPIHEIEIIAKSRGASNRSVCHVGSDTG